MILHDIKDKMNRKDIRWILRFNNYCKALDQLSRFIEQESLNEMEEQGLIQAFEYNHELAWKTSSRKRPLLRPGKNMKTSRNCILPLKRSEKATLTAG